MIIIRFRGIICHAAQRRSAGLLMLVLIGLAACGGSGTRNAPPTISGSARLSWTAPTTNIDGSALTDLAGFRIYYGASANTLKLTIDVPDAGAQGYTVNSLAPGTYYFSVTAYSSAGYESDLSAAVVANIQ